MEASRPARAEDIPRVIELARAMRAELVPMKGGARLLDHEAWPEPLEDAYRRLLDRTDARLVVGTIDGVVLGFAALVVEPLGSGRSLAVITDLFVEPEAREVGIGEAMLEQLVDHARAEDCVGIDARALPGHRATKNFFEDQGFTARALVMHHDLSPTPPTP